MSAGQPSDGLTPESIAHHLTPFSQTPVTVAFSGGVDSTVLLHLLVALRDQGVLEQVEAVHVHHGLSEYADQWAEFCEYICQKWQVPLTLARVSVPEDTGEGIEQAARYLRYGIFEQQVLNGGVLVMGHHQDDQAETLLLRLFRGTGVEGLRGIPQSRSLGEGRLVRPMLQVSRVAIEHYAQHHQLDWIEDESNQDERFSRNFLRQSLIPQIERRWPGASRRMAALTADVEVVNQMLIEQALVALRQCQRKENSWWVEGYSLLNISALKCLSSELQSQVCRIWLKNNINIVPGREQLSQLFAELIDAREDAEPQMKIGKYILRRYRGDMYITFPKMTDVLEKQSWGWPISESVNLEDGLWICAESVGSGSIRLPDHPLTVLRRMHIPADEKIAVAGRSGRKTLKRWLQEYQLPPWCRDRQPFIYDGDDMVAAPGLWICADYYLEYNSGNRLECNRVQYESPLSNSSE